MVKLIVGVTASLLLVSGRSVDTRQATRPPIIDVHLHAYGAANWKGAPPNPVTGKPGPSSADEHMRQTLAAMAQYNIVRAIVSGPIAVVEQWRATAPDKVMASPNFGRPDVDYYGDALPGIESLRGLFKSGRLTAIGEVQAQYEGLSPSDPSLDPYFALAESLDIPVGIHTGSSFPGTPYQGYPRFRLTLGNPLLLEELLIRHPKLRVFMAHGGGHWTREAIALMQMYPQVYMDVGAIWLIASFDPKGTDAWLQELIANGLGDRIMFGTDQLRWPDVIGMAIDVIQSSKTLTDQQKRDILYNNAARFLHLTNQ